MNYACPCCEYLTLADAPPGTFEICPVCFWEDDETQFEDPTAASGANTVSLRQARINYVEFGASERRFVEQVRRPHVAEYPAAETGN